MPQTLAEDAPPPTTPSPHGTCGNCGTPLLGEHCYACGQPIRGLVRHFTSIAGDFFDSVLNLDARTPRTLWPLFSKPGYLTHEYFAGRRVRYVSPVRLFFFMAIVTFFFAQLALGGSSIVQVNSSDDNDDIDASMTVAQAEQRRDAAIAKMDEARKEMRGTPAEAGIAGIDAGERAIRKEAAERIAALQEAERTGRPPPPPEADNDFSFNGKPWDAKTNPLQMSWLPRIGNDWLNALVGRGKKNIERLRNEPEAFKAAILGAIPTMLFLLLPVFALMLKLFYVFRRRLYMEHLIVALHSHAFLCLSLLLVFVAKALGDWLAPAGGAVAVAVGTAEGLLWCWMLLYLLLMQKRIYGQGWTMTLLKYSVLGICYVVLLSIGAAFAALYSLVWM